MSRRRHLSRAILTLTLLVLAVSGCTGPAATGVPPQSRPTDTLVYDVPTAPASPSGIPLPTAGPTGAPPAPETLGPLPRTQLTIMHTNDSRGYLDPCG
jgi:hypothetical protein